jgi:DNA polymerase I-like protein with 3'-5' exonuclease and polymerase domains
MNILMICEPEDIKHAYLMRPILGSHEIKLFTKPVEYITKIKQLAEAVGTTKVICTSLVTLKKLVHRHDPLADLSQVTQSDYRGSLFTVDGIDILILPQPEVLRFERGAEWVLGRYIQKLTNPEFFAFPDLDWKILTPDNIDAFVDLAKSAVLIGIDIETKQVEIDPALVKDNPKELQGIWTLWKKGSSKKLKTVIPTITMVGYTVILRTKGGLVSTTGVLLIKDMTSIYYMRMLNRLSAPKVMQNGGYDSSYFLRYNAPVSNYLFDTYILMHAWVAELKRNLSFITSLFAKNSIHWKDESSRNAPEYCAKDVHNTAWSCMIMLTQMPEWAKENYFENFRMQFPCISCGMEGWLADPEEKEKLRLKRLIEIEMRKNRLHKIIFPGFNPNSPKQLMHMFKGLGQKKMKSSDDKSIKAFREKSPLFDIIGELISTYKKDLKSVSTYFDMILFNNRIMYELNPAGTDTGRLASKKSNFWVGTQIQNIPLYAKSMCIADPGWELFSIDNMQSESRCTAYISEDQNLIAAVESPLDFHKYNCTKFFGVKFEDVTKGIRDTGKRVNHGANYNMGAGVLLQTMGTKAVILAKKLLGLPGIWPLIKVCEYLMECFDKAYPDVRGKYYREVIAEIQTTGKLTGFTGWVRKCFGDPAASKMELNSYVAHAPQSLSVKLINSAFFDMWLKLQLRERKVRFKAQVHDDIIGQNKPEDTEYVTTTIAERMRQPITIRGRVMVIPNDVKSGGQTWKDLKD